MRDLLILAAPLLMLSLLYCGWRAARLFLAWNPAAATVWQSDYTDGQRQDDFWRGGPGVGSLRGWDGRDGEDSRLIEDEITFTDAGGERRRAVVERRVAAGWRPDSVFTIWYDPADPARRVTAFGPGHWLGLALLPAGALAGLFSFGARLAS